MSKKWKIILGVVAALLVIFLGVVGVGIYFGSQFVKGMKVVEQDVYGGPLPATVVGVMGIKLDQSKMAIFMDKSTKIVMVIIENPQESSQKALPFSDLDVEKALEPYFVDAKAKALLAGAEKGTPSTMKLGTQTVHTIQYTDSHGKPCETGVLNLDHAKMLFIETGQTGNAASFLMNMPVIQKDSHLSAQQKPQKAS